MYALVHYRAWTSRSRRPRRHSETSCVPGLPTTTRVRTPRGTTRPSSTGATWQRKLYEAGYAGFSWPKEYGGRGATHGRAGPVRRGDGARQGALPGERARHGDGRAGGDHPRHRRPEGALAQADPDRRRDLVPGLLGARVGLRPGLAQDQGGQVERRVGRDRPEGLDDLRAQGQVVHAGRADRPGRAQAPGPHLLHHGHGAGRGAGAPALPDHPGAGVQRALHRGGSHPGRERRRRCRQRLGRRDHDAHERARRPRRLGRRRRADRARRAQGARPRARRRRGPDHPPAARPARDRGRAAAPELLARR